MWYKYNGMLLLLSRFRRVRLYVTPSTGLRSPPRKNTVVGCHFLLQYVKVKSESEVTQSCGTLRDPMDCRPTRLLHPWDFAGKNTGVGCHFLLLEIFLTQGSKPHLLDCRQILYHCATGKPVNWEMYPQIMEGNANTSE